MIGRFGGLDSKDIPLLFLSSAESDRVSDPPNLAY